MRHIETESSDYEMSDAEFFKLMGIENPVETNLNNAQSTENHLTKHQVHLIKTPAQKKWLTLATTAVIAILLLSLSA